MAGLKNLHVYPQCRERTQSNITWPQNEGDCICQFTFSCAECVHSYYTLNKINGFRPTGGNHFIKKKKEGLLYQLASL